MTINSNFCNHGGEVVRQFLASPPEKRICPDFFKLCYSTVLGYLRFLKKRGYRIQVMDSGSPDDLSDSANYILGHLLAGSEKGQSSIIREYFERKCPDGYNKHDDIELFHLFIILVEGFVKKVLYRLNKEENPQHDNLKRRFKEILIGADFEVFSDNSRDEYFSRKYSGNLREQMPPIPYEELEVVTAEAYFNSMSRTEWCRIIFESLNDLSQFRNMLSKAQLLRAVISVNSKHVLDPERHIESIPDIRDKISQKTFDSAIERTINHLRSEIIPLYIKKGRLEDGQGERLIRAAGNYIIDWCDAHGPRSIHAYFEEVMHSSLHDRYLRDYKYIFDTVLRGAWNYFKSILKNDSTIKKYGDYFKFDVEEC